MRRLWRLQEVSKASHRAFLSILCLMQLNTSLCRQKQELEPACHGCQSKATPDVLNRWHGLPIGPEGTLFYCFGMSPVSLLSYSWRRLFACFSAYCYYHNILTSSAMYSTMKDDALEPYSFLGKPHIYFYPPLYLFYHIWEKFSPVLWNELMSCLATDIHPSTLAKCPCFFLIATNMLPILVRKIFFFNFYQIHFGIGPALKLFIRFCRFICLSKPCQHCHRWSYNNDTMQHLRTMFWLLNFSKHSLGFPISDTWCFWL